MSTQPEIQSVVDTFFAAFASGPGLDERMSALRSALLPGAVVTKMDGHEPQVMDVEGFLAPRHRLLAGGQVEGFREWEVSGRTEVFRAIAHHWCLYSKSWTEGGREHTGHGAKTLQLVDTGDGWRIAAVAWTDDPE